MGGGGDNLICVPKEGESTRGDQSNMHTEGGRFNEGDRSNLHTDGGRINEGGNLFCVLKEGELTRGGNLICVLKEGKSTRADQSIPRPYLCEMHSPFAELYMKDCVFTMLIQKAGVLRHYVSFTLKIWQCLKHGVCEYSSNLLYYIYRT